MVCSPVNVPTSVAGYLDDRIGELARRLLWHVVPDATVAPAAAMPTSWVKSRLLIMLKVPVFQASKRAGISLRV
jgi:hypothetical protein